MTQTRYQARSGHISPGRVGARPEHAPMTSQAPSLFAPCLCPGPVPEGVREDGTVREAAGHAAQPGRHLPGDGAAEERCSEPAGAGPGRAGQAGGPPSQLGGVALSGGAPCLRGGVHDCALEKPLGCGGSFSPSLGVPIRGRLSSWVNPSLREGAAVGTALTGHRGTRRAVWPGSRKGHVWS